MSHAMNSKETIRISGMSCAACAARVEKVLNNLEGVKNAAVNLAVEKAAVEYDKNIISIEDIIDAIKKLGVRCSQRTGGHHQQCRIESERHVMCCLCCEGRKTVGFTGRGTQCSCESCFREGFCRI